MTSLLTKPLFGLFTPNIQARFEIVFIFTKYFLRSELIAIPSPTPHPSGEGG